ncbi:MAG: PQQ-binding-like beta-propeller repeat protein [Vicinamibacterales bacterium]|nr:PQQ-binding-like beta-propeller repeat protein [Vicinamibacterales bacterium]
MTRPTTLLVTLAVTAAAVLALETPQAAVADAERYWPQWRGPHATGVSDHATPPVEWSETKNIRWKVRIPGRGSASPVVWGDRVYLLTAVPTDGGDEHAPRGGVAPRVPHRYVVLALNRADGTVAWQRVAREETPHEASHNQFGTWASSSAVTDGTHLVAYFESRGLYVYDMAGTLVWEKDLGDRRMRNEFGEGTSPALHGNTLVIQWDHQGQSFIVALDKRNGRELWRVERDEIDGWATPLIVAHGGQVQVVTNGMNKVRGYNLATGALLWEGPGTTMNPIPSPVHADGMVFLTSGFRGNNLKAIRLAEARGDLTTTRAIAWTLDRDTPYVPSPLLYRGVLYILKSNNGLLSAFDARTGTPHYQTQRLEGAPNVFASPVAADGRVYIPSQDGTTMVLRHGTTFEALATNALDDRFDASMALVDDTIYLRGYRHLYAIAEER